MKKSKIINLFTTASIKNFPVEECCIQSDREKDILYSEKEYWILWKDKRFEDDFIICLACPYVWVDSDGTKYFGWTTKTFKQPMDNLENPVNNHIWDEVVIGFSLAE